MSTETEIGTIEHLDFDFEAPCESAHTNRHSLECLGVATWAALHPCGCFILVCDNSRRANEISLEKSPEMLVACPRDGLTLSRSEWSPKVIWTRLK